MSILSLLVAALSSLVVGFIWYNPKVFGTVWMKEAKINMDENNKPSKAKMFQLMGLTFVFAFLMSLILQSLVIHQSGIYSLIGGDVAHAKPSFHAFMADYQGAFRTFKHGALHGFLTGLFFVFPLIATNGLYESKSWKYIFVVSGFWTTCLSIMGGIICAW